MKKVAAYCRVSTDNEDQANSLISQQKYFTDYIARQPDWELYKVYVDEGITGTSTKKRKAFNSMIEDAQMGMFDFIITKEISRFARNTLDSIFYTRKLKDLGIGVMFMNDNINTIDADAELRLTIMSSIAQEESRKTSERVKWGQKRRMEQGVVFGRDMLGYDVADGKLIINEDGASVVRQIFHMFANENMGCHTIAKRLAHDNIKTSTHMKRWSNTVILRVLRNEKYVGDLIQKKTFTPSYLTHEKKYNRGQEEMVILHNHHEPIISREIWDRTQAELARRAPSEQQKARHSNRYAFSGKIKCGYCGATFVSRTKKLKNGTVYKGWRCYEAANHGSKHIDDYGEQVGCDGRTINNQDLLYLMGEIVANLKIDKELVTNNLLGIIKSVLSDDEQQSKRIDYQLEITKISDKKEKLLELFVSGDVSKADYQKMNKKYEQEIIEIKAEQTEQENRFRLMSDKDSLLKSIASKMGALLSGEQDETLFKNLLEKIIVCDKASIDVILNLLPYTFKARIERCNLGTSHPISVRSALQ